MLEMRLQVSEEQFLTVEAKLGSGVQLPDSKAQTDVLLRPVFISTNSISSLKGPKESGRRGGHSSKTHLGVATCLPPIP